MLAFGRTLIYIVELELELKHGICEGTWSSVAAGHKTAEYTVTVAKIDAIRNA